MSDYKKKTNKLDYKELAIIGFFQYYDQNIDTHSSYIQYDQTEDFKFVIHQRSTVD